MKNKLLLSYLLFFIMTGFGFMKAQTIDSTAVDGQLYVKLFDHENRNLPIYNGGSTSGFSEDVKALIQKFQINSIQKAFPDVTNSSKISRIYRINFSAYNDVELLISQFAGREYVEFAEKVPLNKIFCTNEGATYPNYWTTQAQSGHLNLINACGAWGISTGNNTVNVAIVDNEFNLAHADLTNITQSWDVADNDNNVSGPNATFDHGTHVAGIAGGSTNNNVGIASIGRNISLMVAKVTSNAAAGNSVTHGYQGITWAMNNGAQVINCSWGGTLFSAAEQIVIDNAVAQGIVIVAAAGNDNNNVLHYPAAYNGVYAVANTDLNDVKNTSSCFGNWVDISAPGTNILSTLSNGGYGTKTGTSMASPMVAGLCGLILSNNPNYSIQQVTNCISSTADLIGQLNNPIYAGQLGTGRINALAALQCSQTSGNYVAFTASQTTICRNTAITFTDQSVTNSPILTWNWNLPGSTTPVSNLQNPVVTYPNGGEYSVTLTITTANGTFTQTYNTYVSVIGVLISNPTAINPVCRGAETQVNLIISGTPQYSVVFNINGGTSSTSNFNHNFVPLYFNTSLNATNTNVNITSITSNGLTCNVNENVNIPTVNCCGELISNGDFSLGDAQFTSENFVNCGSQCPGNYCVGNLSGPTVTFGGFWNVYPTAINRGTSLAIDGRGNPNSICGTNQTPFLTGSFGNLTPQNFSSVLWEQQVTLINNANYNFSFFTTQGNHPFFTPLHLRVRIVDLMGTTVYTSPVYNVQYTIQHTWQQYYSLINNPVAVDGAYRLIIEQFEFFATSNYDFLIDDISLRVINNPLASVSLTANPTQICSGESSTLSYTANNFNSNSFTQSWTIVPNTVAFATTNTVSVSPSVTTTYSMTIVESNTNCTASNSVTINSGPCGIYCSDPVTQAIPDMATSATNPITATTVDILGTYTISSSITYSNIRFRMAPNSQIIVPAGVTLSLSGCKLFSCTDMWNGILIQGNTAELIANNTWFEDAISAVNSIGGGKYNISKSRFNKNYTGIYIDTYTPANSSIVQSSIFECQTSLTSPGATLKAPYLNTVSHYGIDVLNNAGGLTFGLAGGTGLQNEFRFIDIGIHSSKSKITVHNNYFHDLRRHCVQTPMDDPCQAEGWGIWAETFGELYVGNIATTNTFNNTYSNTFRNCDGGIMAQVHVRKIEIYKNKFEGIGSLVVAEPNRKAINIISNFNSEVDYCIIENNKFKDNFISVQYQGNKYRLGRINSNKFNNSGDYGIKCTQNYNGLATHVLDIKYNSMNDSTSLNSIYGIAVQNAVTTNSPRVTIESNSIKKIQRAIWVTSIQNKAQVIKHNVNYSAISTNAGIIFSAGTATVSNPNCGITVEYCKGIHVKENDVMKQGSNPNSTFSNSSYGITSKQSTSAVISNNTVHKLGRGLILIGTPNASVVTCNYLDKNFYGLFLDATNIVNQGSSTLAQDNQWVSSNISGVKTVYGVNSSVPIFYSRSSSVQFKPLPVSMFPGPPSAAPIDFQLTLPNPAYNCLFGCASPPCINPNLARIVKREPPFDLLPAEEQLIADFSTLQMIKENDSLTQFGQPEANTLIAFKDSLLNTNTGLLQTFVEKMDSGDSLLAKQALMAVVPSYSPEENAKIVDEVYYRTWAKDLFELSREDSARLLQVAQQWPVKGGTAVFDARVMIGYWQNDHFVVDNNNARLANISTEDAGSITDNYGVLYPNPAQNIINYDITLEEGETGLLIIYDVTGKLINSQKIVEGESKSIIDCENWNSGIYFYRLLINGEPKASKSFMISK